MQNLFEIASHPRRAFLLTQDEELVAFLQRLWPSDQIIWHIFSNGQFVLEQVFSEPPDMVIAEQFLPGLNGIDVLRILKEENVYRQICAILMVRSVDLPALQSVGLDVDELIILPASADDLRIRVELAQHRTKMTLDANPLTRLPGNTSIINTAQRLLSVGTDFALAYVDMDNFKPYNDRYGFSRGDEILLMAARLMVNNVTARQCELAFLGHIGGDDFVFTLSLDDMEEACKRLISDFDAIVPSFYDPDDRARGSILSHDRHGNEVLFPILSISVAIVPNINKKYSHYAQLSHAAGQLKKIAKTIHGSNYVIDRRQ